MRELQHRSNNAYDSILLVENDTVIGAWTVGERGDEMQNYRNPGDLNDWPETFPDETDPDEYGALVDRSGSEFPAMREPSEAESLDDLLEILRALDRAGLERRIDDLPVFWDVEHEPCDTVEIYSGDNDRFLIIGGAGDDGWTLIDRDELRR